MLLVDFNYWFVGFIEGSNDFNYTNLNSITFKISYISDDVQILFKIKKNLGFGQVKKVSKCTFRYIYVITSEKSLLTIINFLNGSLVLKSSVEKLNFFIQKFNKKFNYNIICHNTLVPFSLKTGWLAGFTDAKGFFDVSILNGNNKLFKFYFRYNLKLKSLETEFGFFFLKLLKVKVLLKKIFKSYFLIINLNSNKVLLNYFKKFKLLTKKNISFIKLMKLKRILLINKDMKEIIKIASKINKF